MAIYVGIWKVSEDETSALYAFGPNEHRTGQIRITKGSGDVAVISEVPDDTKSAYSACAARKLVKHWRSNEYPEKTCFAS